MSCLFDSLSTFLTDINSSQLRHIITHFLSQDPSFFEEESGKLSDILSIDNVRLEEYVNAMSNPNTWGGAIEIRAFSEIYKVRVLVQIHDRIIEFLPKHEYNFTIRIHYTGNHYEPIDIVKEN